jgi:hypothetical protein
MLRAINGPLADRHQDAGRAVDGGEGVAGMAKVVVMPTSA